MSNYLQNSVSSHKAVISNSSRASSASSIGGKCFGSLFSCFNKITHNRAARRFLNNYEHQDYEYVVEKLVVKRVPITFFGISRHVSKTKTVASESYTVKEPSVTKGNPIFSRNTSERSLLYYSDCLNQNGKAKRIPNKYLHLDRKESASNQRNKTNEMFPEHDTRITELLNIMTSLHPDLKNSERPPKDPCPLNESNNKYLSFQSFPEISSNKSLSESDKNYVQQTFVMPVTDVLQTNLMIKDGSYVDSPEIKLEDAQEIHNKLEGINNNFIDKEIFIVQPAEDVFHNCTNFEKTVVETNQLIEDQCDHNQTKTKPSNDKVLCEDLETFPTEPKIIKEKTAIANPLPVTVKWKIFVKHCKSKP